VFCFPFSFIGACDDEPFRSRLFLPQKNVNLTRLTSISSLRLNRDL